MAMLSALRQAADASGISFRARFGVAFVWHAVIASVTWAVLAPLGFAVARFLRRAGRGGHRVHRFAMIFVLALTVVTWYIGISYASRKVPPAHAALGSLVTVLAVLQGLAGAMRPPLDAGGVRAMWVTMHRGLGGVSLAVAAYTVHHSITVFDLSRKLGILLNIVLGVAITCVLVVEMAPEKLFDWIGRRPQGYFGDGLDEGVMEGKFANEIGGVSVDFREVEDEEREEEMLALSSR